MEHVVTRTGSAGSSITWIVMVTVLVLLVAAGVTWLWRWGHRKQRSGARRVLNGRPRRELRIVDMRGQSIGWPCGR